MWKRDGTRVWENMDAGGKTRPGTSGSYDSKAGGPGNPDGYIAGTGSSAVIPGGLTSYGMSVAANDMRYGIKKNVILILDYSRSTAQCSTATALDPWTDWHKSNGIPNFARHWEKANVLFSDGGVRLMDTSLFNPIITSYRNEYWAP